MRLTSTLTIALLIAATPLTAQVAPVAPDTMAFGLLHRMVGQWKGSAWMMTQTGKETVIQQESVRKNAGGAVITVEGLGLSAEPNGKERVVHSAFAVIHFDRDLKTPVMRAFLANGLWMDFEVKITPTTLSWHRSDPYAGMIRYDVVIDATGHWVEKGFNSRDDGKTWTQIMEMTLTKVP